jgi:hypothetical protein
LPSIILKPYPLPSGYHYVTLSTVGRGGGGGNRGRDYVHKIVLTTFVGPRPKGMECRHLNGDRGDNRLENLRWGTRMENLADMVRHGTDPQGERNGAARLTDDAVRAIRSMHWKFLEVLARRFGVTTLNVRAVVLGKTWKHVRRGGPDVKP